MRGKHLLHKRVWVLTHGGGQTHVLEKYTFAPTAPVRQPQCVRRRSRGSFSVSSLSLCTWPSSLMLIATWSVVGRCVDSRTCRARSAATTWPMRSVPVLTIADLSQEGTVKRHVATCPFPDGSIFTRCQRTQSSALCAVLNAHTYLARRRKH